MLNKFAFKGDKVCIKCSTTKGENKNDSVYNYSECSLEAQLIYFPFLI